MPGGKFADAERSLREYAIKKWPDDVKHQDEYVFGKLRELGWKPHHRKRERTSFF